VGGEFVDEGPAMGSRVLRSFANEETLVVKPGGGGKGRSLVGLGEREVPARPSVVAEVGFFYFYF
jgi:hypothetical protein